MFPDAHSEFPKSIPTPNAKTSCRQAELRVGCKFHTFSSQPRMRVLLVSICTTADGVNAISMKNRNPG